MGAGAAGKVDFPSHMKLFHASWLGDPTGAGYTNISTVMNALITGNTPYDGESAFDPDTYFSDVNTDRATWGNRVGATSLNNATVWENAVDTAAGKAHSTSVVPKTNIFDVDMTADAVSDTIAAFEGVGDNAAVQALITEFENRNTKRQQRAIARFTAGMADVNAVMSSAFTIGLAILEADATDQVNEFEAKVSQELFSDLVKAGVQAQLGAALSRVEIRHTLLSQGTQLVNQGKYQAISMFADYVRGFAEISRVRTVAKVEQTERDIELDTAEALWDISVFQHGGNFLSSISGAPMVPKGLTKTQSAIGGALSGASVGAAAGSVIPGLGNIVGAGVGALIGGIGGAL